MRTLSPWTSTLVSFFNPNAFKVVPNCHIDTPERATTVCLPYSLVPDMTISSPLFLKAVSTIGKQQKPGASSTSTSSTASEKKSETFNTALGTLSQFLFTSSLRLILLFFLDPLAGLINAT